MELFDSWLRSLRAAGRSPATLEAYRADIVHLARHLGTEDVETTTRRQVEEFLVDCLDRGLAPATVARRYRSLQQFFRWLHAEREIKVNPMATMKPPTVPLQPPDVLTDEELLALVNAARSKADHGRAGEFERRRDTAMLLLLITTGIRSSELLGLRVDDVHLAAETFTVLGKGNKLRTVSLLPQPAEAVDRYLRARRKHPHAKSPMLWLGEKGPLTTSGLRQMLERRSTSAGIRHVNPHLFRHTFAHRAKSRGMSDDALMSVAGWNTTQMLHRYGASAVAERGRAAHRQLFGEDRL